MRSLVTVALLALVLAACGDDEPRRTAEDEPPSFAAPSPADGEYEYGHFRFGRAYSGGGDEGAALDAHAWDIVYYLDDGELGSWSAGYRLFESADEALDQAREMAHRWPCAGEATPLEGLDADGYDFLEGSSCRGLIGEDRYVAQLSAARAATTVTLVVGGPTARHAEAAARAVWVALSAAVESASAS